MEKKRKEHLSWDEYFMSIAALTAMRSKDPNTKVGACIVAEDNRVLSVGYNGAPNGFADSLVPFLTSAAIRTIYKVPAFMSTTSLALIAPKPSFKPASKK